MNFGRNSFLPKGVSLHDNDMANVLRYGVIVILMFLPGLLIINANIGQNTLWIRIMPRLAVVAFVVTVVLCAFRPKWSLPLYIVLIGPLTAFSTVVKTHIGRYPFVLFSIAIWGLGLFWMIRGPRQKDTRNGTAGTALGTGIWLAMLCSGFLAFSQNPANSDEGIITQVILIRGCMEGFIVFMVTKAWIKYYGDISVLTNALFLSLAVALFVGLSTYGQLEMETGNKDVSLMRYHLVAYGGANFSGMAIIIIYPFIFLSSNDKDRALTILVAVFIWGLAFATLSRATPIVLGFETILLMVGTKKIKIGAMAFLVAITILVVSVPFLSQGIKNYWNERWEATDVLGLITGHGKNIDNSDRWREDMKSIFWEELPKRPFGGYGAAGQVDPENIYLDLALQLGWVPCGCLILLQGVLLVTAAMRANDYFNGKDAYGFVIFVVVFGEFAYCYVVGVNLTKVGIGETGIIANSVPAVLLAIGAAICLERSEGQPQLDGDAVGPGESKGLAVESAWQEGSGRTVPLPRKAPLYQGRKRNSDLQD